MPLVELDSTDLYGHEPCWYLAEVNRQAPDYSGDRRYQTITVIRNDKKMKFERDIGDARLFGEQFQLICGVPDGKGGGALESGIDTATRSLPVSLLLNVATAIAEPLQIDTYVVYDSIYWIDQGGNIQVSM